LKKPLAITKFQAFSFLLSFNIFVLPSTCRLCAIVPIAWRWCVWLAARLFEIRYMQVSASDSRSNGHRSLAGRIACEGQLRIRL
jgi:hypothetical protein